MARKAGQGKEEEESRARQQEEKTPVREGEKTPARHGRGHHVVEQELYEEALKEDEDKNQSNHEIIPDTPAKAGLGYNVIAFIK
ncbi:hypothetical protein STEG23_030481, partial [Scotinomys teguina]